MYKFYSDFNFFWDKIQSYSNFSFARYADGEVMLIKGLPINKNTQAYTVDNWYSDNVNSRIGNELLDSLYIVDESFYFAISSKTDNIDDYNFLFSKIENKKNLTFANLWINANYDKTIEKIKSLNREVVLICNYRCDIKNMPFNVIDFIPFPDDCVNYWENKESDSFKELIVKKSIQYKDKIFIICCGPASAIIVSKMFIKNKNNTYIDFGSSLDFFIHGKITRPYMDKNSMYSNHVSFF